MKKLFLIFMTMFTLTSFSQPQFWYGKKHFRPSLKFLDLPQNDLNTRFMTLDNMGKPFITKITPTTFERTFDISNTNRTVGSSDEGTSTYNYSYIDFNRSIFDTGEYNYSNRVGYIGSICERSSFYPSVGKIFGRSYYTAEGLQIENHPYSGTYGQTDYSIDYSTTFLSFLVSKDGLSLTNNDKGRLNITSNETKGLICNLQAPDKAGYFIIGTTADDDNLPVYPDNASAIACGLAVNKKYRTETGQLMITY